jgi:hypothetical protein
MFEGIRQGLKEDGFEVALPNSVAGSASPSLASNTSQAGRRPE